MATARSTLEAIVSNATPSAEARAAASRHRQEIEDWLKADLDIIRMRETGSWHHGTALDRFSDVDYLVSMTGTRPASSADVLDRICGSLNRGFSGAYASVNRPAVRLRFFDDGPDVEITPGYYRATDDYHIPDPDGSGWIKSNPAVHLAYVNEVQRKTDNGAKGLVRLVKTWKAFNQVPLSSFYLEMRTAQYALANKQILLDWDLVGVFRALSRSGLAAMNDPTDYGRRISSGTSGLAEAFTAKFAVEEAERLADLAKKAADNGDHGAAINYLLQLFKVQP